MNAGNMKYEIDTSIIKSTHVAIIGVDGSGKSSCFNSVFKSLQYKKKAAIGDDVFISVNKGIVRPKLFLLRMKLILGRRVKGIKNRKLYRIFKFIELLMRVKIFYLINRKYSPEIILTDGSPLINILGWGHYYCPDIYGKELCEEAIKYMTGTKIPKNRKVFFKKHSREMLAINRLGVKFHVPELVFLLKVTPEEAINRIKHRHEEIQVHETKTFLSNLQDSYEIICNILKKSKTVSINTDNKTIEDVAGKILLEIEKNLKAQ